MDEQDHVFLEIFEYYGDETYSYWFDEPIVCPTEEEPI